MPYFITTVSYLDLDIYLEVFQPKFCRHFLIHLCVLQVLSISSPLIDHFREVTSINNTYLYSVDFFLTTHILLTTFVFKYPYLVVHFWILIQFQFNYLSEGDL